MIVYMPQFKYIPTKIFQTLILSFLSMSLIAQTTSPSDTSYFVPWDDNYNLLLAVDKADTLSIKLLLDRGASVNTTTIDGVTPLMYAAESGNLNIVKLLVDRGSDINKKPFIGASALIMAAKKNYYEIAEYLVSKKANLNIRDDEGVTAVHYAAAFNNFDVMDMLIFYGADMELADYKGNTPLISTAYNNSVEAADLLLQNGALIDTVDIYGFSALMTAIQRGNMEMAYLLIDKGANIHAVNEGGYSALAFAVTAKDADLTETLINMGANVNQKTKSGYSILEIARLTNDDEVIELLQSNDAKSNLNAHFNTFSLGPYLDFNFTDYMNGIQGSILDSRYGIGLNGGFGFRPIANRVLFKESDTLSYQFWERRYYLYAGVDKKFDFLRNNDVATGPYLGVNEYFTFGGYKGSEKNPPIKLITSPSAGWYFSNNYFRAWIGYQYLDYKTPEIKPGRIILGISVNISLIKRGLTNKKIDWLE
jgi:ankyrin repeat protein